MTKKIVLVSILLSMVLQAFALSPLKEGEKLFMENKPQEALPYLEEALATDPNNEKIYLYLGIVYEQLNQPEKSISLMRRGAEIGGSLKHMLYYNIGNNFYKQGENILAEEMYTKSIGLSNSFAEPYLNRANARLNLKNYQGALNDYTIYLKLKPHSSQRYEVEKMIELLRKFLEEKEQKEKDRIAKERALMDEVLNALKNASEDAKNLSTGSDEILIEKEKEVDIAE
jgi:tetratricopeptide (TPR) repeat protein